MAKRNPTGDYEIGYCRPPKANRFKKKSRRKPAMLDVAKLLAEPVTVGKDGTKSSMTPFEIAFRAQAKKAIVGKSLRAALWVLTEAEKHGLLAPPPEPEGGGGVLVVPGRLRPEDWAAIFEPREISGVKKSNASDEE